MTRPPALTSIERPWVRSYPPGVPPSYRFPDVALPRLLDDAVRDFPEREALRTEDLAVSYRQLRDHVTTTAQVLRELGVGSGDRVLLATGTRVTTPIVLLALWRLGAAAVPFPPGRDRGRAARRAVEAAQAAEVVGVIASRVRLDELAQAGPAAGWQLDVTDESWLRPPRRFRRPRRGPRQADGGVVPLVAAVTEFLGRPVTAHSTTPPSPDQPALLVPRWRGGDRRTVLLTHRNLVASTFQARLWVPDVQAGREHVVVAGSLLGLGPMVLGWLAGLLAAATVEVVPGSATSGLARRIQRSGATLAVLEPPQVAALVAEDSARRDLSSLRVVLAAGFPLDPDLAEELERRSGGARVREGFGVTEAGPITHAQPVYGRTTPGAMGLPVTDTVAVVVDPEDLSRVCAPGEPGLLLLSGPQVSPGYDADPAATAARFQDGWLVTDDLVTVDPDGVFTHLGRRDEVLADAEGGLVSPRRIEAVLERHPAVRRAGVTSETTSGALVAGVECRRRHRPSEEELLAHCQAHLESRMVPGRVILVDELPENDAGEVAREVLRALLAAR